MALPHRKDQQASERRYEWKYVVPSQEAGVLEGWIRSHIAGFKETYPQRTISSLYWDTPLLDCYNENLDGISEREKWRLRWYESELPKQAQIEHKQKHNRTSLKEVYPLVLPKESSSFREMRRTILKQLPATESARFAGMTQPVVLVQYIRQYFAAGPIRLTLDTKLNAFSQLHTLRLSERYRLPMPDIAIMECKAPVELENEARQVMSSCPVRLSRSSKYVIAVQAALGE